MTDIDRLESEYREIASAESEVQWLHGDKLIKDMEAGYKLDDLAKLCEPIFGIGRTAIRNRHKTATIFRPEQRALELSWSMHRLASTACRVTRPDDFKLAHDWIDEASKGKMTYDMLGDAMAAAKGKVHISEPVYLCKRVKARVGDIKTFNAITYFEVFVDSSDIDLISVTPNTRILLTMFVPANEATESEVAA